MVGCCALIAWACLRVYDNQHAAAPAARRLWSLRATDRIAAIRELEGSGRVDSVVATPALIRALEDTDAEVRAGAAMALVSSVTGVAGGNSPTVTNVRSALRALVKVLDDPQPAVRATAARALWMIVLVNQVPAGLINVEPVMDALINRLDDPEPAVRLSAIQGLGAVGPNVLGDPPARLVAAMEEESDKLRDAVVEALAAFREGLPPLIPSLVKAAEGAGPPVRAGYLRLLSRIRRPQFSGDAVPGLNNALASKDGAIVAVAANDLLAYEDAATPYRYRKPARSSAPTAVPALITALIPLIDGKAGDELTPDPVVAIAKALGRLAPDTPSSEEAVAALSKLLRAGASGTRRRVAAANALGQFRAGDSLFAALADTVEEKNLAVRVAVLGAIHDVDFGAPFVIPKSLGAALEDDSAEVRTAAASALSRAGLGVDPYVPALFRHAEHDVDTQVRIMCAWTLQHLAESRKVTATVLPDLIEELASQDAIIRFFASEILAAIGPAAAPAVPALIGSLRNPKAAQAWANPRVGAAKALGQIAPRTPMAEKAMIALIEAMRVDETGLKNEAIRALAEFGPAAAPALPQLIQVMNEARAGKDNLIALSCAMTLLKAGSKGAAAAIDTLSELAERGNPTVRSLAAKSLTDLKVVD
jgi:HEAT repeat protein